MGSKPCQAGSKDHYDETLVGFFAPCSQKNILCLVKQLAMETTLAVLLQSEANTSFGKIEFFSSLNLTSLPHRGLHNKLCIQAELVALRLCQASYTSEYINTQSTAFKSSIRSRAHPRKRLKLYVLQHKTPSEKLIVNVVPWTSVGLLTKRYLPLPTWWLTWTSSKATFGRV